MNEYPTAQIAQNDWQIQIEEGATATFYEPYQGETYDITFPSEAGTVYGGTLDVTSGVLTVDRAMYKFTGNESPYVQQTARVAIKLPFNLASVEDGWCSDFDVFGTSTVNYIYINATLTADELKEYMQTHDVYAVVYIATPQTYQLTPQEITSLLGTNNVWADTGDSDAEYRADTKLYITKKITEAVSALS